MGSEGGCLVESMETLGLYSLPKIQVFFFYPFHWVQIYVRRTSCQEWTVVVVNYPLLHKVFIV